MKKRELHYPKHIYRHFVIEDPQSSYRHGTLPVMFESDWHVDWPQEYFTSPELQGWNIVSHGSFDVISGKINGPTILHLLLRVVMCTGVYTEQDRGVDA
jgi:hypothetical protein